MFCVLLSFLLASCSLPRIVILDDPLTPEEHINLGLSYEKQGDRENALREYKTAAEKLPLAYLYLGNISCQQGRLDEAEDHYRKAIEELPDLSEAYNNLAWLLYTKGERLDEAESFALKALELRPSDENYRDTLKRIREAKPANGI